MGVMKHLNPVKHCGGCKEQKRDEKILVDTDSGNLKAPLNEKITEQLLIMMMIITRYNTCDAFITLMMMIIICNNLDDDL